MSSRLLEHLAPLIACNTENPPRSIDAGHAIFDYIRGVLPDGFQVEVNDHGDGHVSFLAVRGSPRILFNVHLDTVPVGNGWTRPPLELTLEDGRAYGRGVCDIKGAAAALLTLAESSDADLAMLFTTDEEGAHGCCVKNYLSELEKDAWDLVVVAEPTGCQAVLGHRGYLSVIGEFSGVAGHSSEPRGLTDNALHKLGLWMADAVRQADGADACFNIGEVQGGIKSNVIADRARVTWSARLAPGRDNTSFFHRLTASATDVKWLQPFQGPPLPAPGRDDETAAVWAARLGWPVAPQVDFWTEASLFSLGDLPALVLGPGDIAQAHTPDEWLELAQLDEILKLYEKVAQHG
jgi:acetylornithine deacetylase